jgi:hypothetical protein
VSQPQFCDDCGTPLVLVDQPTPLVVWDCPKCAEDGPSERQISDAANWCAEPRMSYLDKDDLGRGGLT